MSGKHASLLRRFRLHAVQFLLYLNSVVLSSECLLALYHIFQNLMEIQALFERYAITSQTYDGEKRFPKGKCINSLLGFCHSDIFMC